MSRSGCLLLGFLTLLFPLSATSAPDNSAQEGPCIVYCTGLDGRYCTEVEERSGDQLNLYEAPDKSKSPICMATIALGPHDRLIKAAFARQRQGGDPDLILHTANETTSRQTVLSITMKLVPQYAYVFN